MAPFCMRPQFCYFWYGLGSPGHDGSSIRFQFHFVNVHAIVFVIRRFFFPFCVVTVVSCWICSNTKSLLTRNVSIAISTCASWRARFLHRLLLDCQFFDALFARSNFMRSFIFWYFPTRMCFSNFYGYLHHLRILCELKVLRLLFLCFCLIWIVIFLLLLLLLSVVLGLIFFICMMKLR